MAAIDHLERVDITVDGVTKTVVGGSFRGVPFFVEDYERRGDGRNVVSKPIPFSSNYTDEDLGGKIPEFPINIYLIGEECIEVRDKLIEACNKEGAGELVHPFFGRFKANCIGLTFAGSRTGVNYTTAQIEFRPASGETLAVQTNLGGATKRLAKNLQQDSVSKFATVFSIVGKGKNALDKAVSVTEDAMNSIENSRAVLATANDFISEIGKIKANAAVIMLAPADFAARLSNLITATKDLFGIDQESDDVDEYLNVLEGMRGQETGTTPAGRITNLVMVLTASQVVSSLVDSDFSNVEDAVACQNRISAAFDDLLEVVSDVDDYMALSNLESTALGYLRNVMADVAVVLEKEITYSNNILQLCYDVYGSVDRVDEIMNRNEFVQGIFILPGKVKVLSK